MYELIGHLERYLQEQGLTSLEELVGTLKWPGDSQD
jgi:hypothetical protein